MPPLSAVERFFERLLERPVARLFGVTVQPIQVLRRLERAVEGGRVSRGGATLAPDRFTVRLNPRDLARLDDAVAAELASGVLSFARRHDLRLADRPRVRILADDAVERGGIEVEVTISDPGVGDLDPVTRAFPVPRPAAVAVTLAIREPGAAPRTVVIGDRSVTIGRSTTAEIHLDDREISREHARIATRDGVLVLTDLGSTNGTWVGGRRVREVVLGAGDRIDLGGTSLVVLGDLGERRDV
jgi:hypothetical protein